MTKLGVEVTDSTMTGLERRVVRLASIIERATVLNPDKKARDIGAQLADRLSEWLDDIKDLREVGDEDVGDLIKSFELRLKMAEKKVETWRLPYTAKDLPARRRRRSPRAA